MMKNLDNFDEELINLSLNNSTDKNEENKIQSIYSENKEEIDLLISAKNLFLDEYCRQEINNYIKNEINSNLPADSFNIKKNRENGKQIWTSMNDKEKKFYENKINFKKDKDFYSQISSKNPNRINGYNLFTRDEMASSREKNKTKTIVECAKDWRKSDKKLKEIYKEYADLLREERNSQQSGLYIADKELNNLKLPWGPFKFFIKENYFSNEETLDKNYINLSEKWDNLSDEEKNKYFELSEIERHEYVNKKLEYLLQIKNKNKPPRTAFNLFNNDIKYTYTNEYYHRIEYFDFLFEKWNNLTEEEKLEYKNKELNEKKEFLEEREKERLIKYYHNKIKDNININMSHLSTESNEPILKNKNKNFKNKKMIILSDSEFDAYHSNNEDEIFNFDKKNTNKRKLKFL